MEETKVAELAGHLRDWLTKRVIPTAAGDVLAVPFREGFFLIMLCVGAYDEDPNLTHDQQDGIRLLLSLTGLKGDTAKMYRPHGVTTQEGLRNYELAEARWRQQSGEPRMLASIRKALSLLASVIPEGSQEKGQHSQPPTLHSVDAALVPASAIQGGGCQHGVGLEKGTLHTVSPTAWAILKRLVKSPTPMLRKNLAGKPDLDDPAFLLPSDEETIGGYLNELIDKNYATRPDGPRKGAIATDIGRQYVVDHINDAAL